MNNFVKIKTSNEVRKKSTNEPLLEFSTSKYLFLESNSPNSYFYFTVKPWNNFQEF